MARTPILSFFAGGGLLDLGLEQAGFNVVWSNETNDDFADMYEHAMTTWRKSQRLRPYKTLVSDRKSITELGAKEVLRAAFPSGLAPLYGVVGGPPCPDFSNGGTHSGHAGKHGKLTRVFVEMILRIRPHFFLIENVAGLYVFRKHRQHLNELLSALRADGSYVVDCRLLNALALGVPQNRERVFIVGCLRTIAERALDKDLAQQVDGWFPWPEIPAYKDAKDLPWPKANRYGETPGKPASIPDELTAFSALAGNGDPELLPNGMEYFRAHSRKFHTRAEGEVSGKSFKRLHRYRYSPTAWYGNQEVHLHPWKPRRLSVREALRLQSVPDEYVLPEGQTLSAKFKLICNGVPCRMAELLGLELRRFLSRGTTGAPSND